MGRKTNVTPVVFKEAIGVEIRKLRKKHDLTQGELAKMLGINHSCISRYERGTDDISIWTFFQLCRALEEEPVAIMYIWEEVILELQENGEEL